MRSTLFLALALGPMFPALASASDEPVPYTTENFRAHVAYLASDELEGRATGTPGSVLAGDYITQRLRDLGLEPLGDEGTYFQSFTLEDGTPARNILARLPGRGDLGDSVVVVSAHYDHLGRRPERGGSNGDRLCNGANDNASGVAALLLIAEDLVRRRDTLPASHRGMVFAAFDAEEKGLLGSRHYTAHPPIPLSGTAAVVNFDMIGRLSRGKLYAGDAPSSPVLVSMLDRIGRELDVVIETRFGGVARSDQAPFLDREVPGVHFNTGLYPEYHTARDELDRLDMTGGARASRAGGELVRELVRYPDSLPYERLDPSYDIQHAIRLVTVLGAIPNIRAQEGRYPQVLFVAPGSPAARCGVRAGDQLAAVNGQAIERVEDAVALVPHLRLDQAVHVTVIRSGREVEVVLPAEVFAPLAGPEVRPRDDGLYDVNFRYVPPPGTRPRTVHLAGTFNNWKADSHAMTGPDPDGGFTARIALRQGTYQYKFVIDGRDWTPDPRNIHQVGADHNSVVWAGTR
jgi:hypothetical protein